MLTFDILLTALAHTSGSKKWDASKLPDLIISDSHIGVSMYNVRMDGAKKKTEQGSKHSAIPMLVSRTTLDE